MKFLSTVLGIWNRFKARKEEKTGPDGSLVQVIPPERAVSRKLISERLVCQLKNLQPDAKCSRCGADLGRPTSGTVSYCPFCGSPIMNENSTESLKVSPDRRRVAYVSKSRSVMVDGEEGKRYDDIVKGTLLFSPDSKRVAYAAKQGDKEFVVVDGDEGKQYDSTHDLIFSQDSKRVAYKATSGDKHIVVVDGKEEKQYDGIGEGILLFSPDSKWVAYGAKSGDKHFVVVDGKEEKPYDSTGGPVFSPDGKRVAYVAISGDKHFVVVDGKEEKRYDHIFQETLTFSADGKGVAYGALLDGILFVVVDGKEKVRYELDPCFGGGSILFSPDSSRVACLVVVPICDSPMFPSLMVVDGKWETEYGGTMKHYWGLHSFIFSPDGNRFAYAAQSDPHIGWGKNAKYFVAVDWKEEEQYSYDAILRGSLIFSPDSKRVAYVARPEGYGFQNAKSFVVVDGTEGRQYDEILVQGGGYIIFDSSKSVHYLARTGENIYLVEERLD